VVNAEKPNRNGAEWGAWLNLGVYVLLAVTKCWIGVKTQSQALMADGLNNASDILLSLAILIGVRVAVQPPDKNHPYGHRKAETVASLFAAAFMLIVALEVWIRAADSLLAPQREPIHPLALYLSLGSGLLMWMVSVINGKLSQKENSEALRAAAQDNRSDALVSIGAAAGIFGSQWGYPWMDPLAAFLVGAMIIKTVYEVGMPAVHALMDGFDDQKLREIEKQVKAVEGIHEVRELRARSHGSFVHVELTVGVDPHLSVKESHSLTERVEQRLLGFHNIVHVHVHVEPVSGM